jgi:hypothetical protein
MSDVEECLLPSSAEAQMATAVVAAKKGGSGEPHMHDISNQKGMMVQVGRMDTPLGPLY